MILNKIKKLSKDQAVSVHVTKAYKGSSRIAPRILNLGMRWKQVIKLMLWPTYPSHRENIPNMCTIIAYPTLHKALNPHIKCYSCY